jgi:hypothetical protein
METVNISLSVVMLVVLVPVTLFVVYVIVMSIWDAWAPYVRGLELGEKLKAKRVKASAEVRELDFSGKRARLEREREEWMADFFVALGADRESFVRQWSGGSERLVLAQSLREDYEEAVAEGWKFRAEVLNGLRHKVTAYPEKELSSKKLADIRALQEELKERHLLSYETAGWRY